MRFNLVDRILEVEPGPRNPGLQEPDPGRRIPGRPLSDFPGHARRPHVADVGGGRGRLLRTPTISNTA